MDCSFDHNDLDDYHNNNQFRSINATFILSAVNARFVEFNNVFFFSVCGWLASRAHRKQML